MRTRHVLGVGTLALLAVLALAVSASGTHARAGSLKANTAVSGTVTFDGIWTSSSGATQFADVIKAFNVLYPNVKINYKPVGDNLPTVIGTALAGGHPPDIIA